MVGARERGRVAAGGDRGGGAGWVAGWRGGGGGGAPLTPALSPGGRGRGCGDGVGAVGVAAGGGAPRAGAAGGAGLSVGGHAVLHLPDRRAVAGLRSHRALAGVPRRLRRHGLARPDDGRRHRGLHVRHLRHERHRHQPALALGARGRAGARDRDGVRDAHRLVLGAHRGHLHDHDHAGHRGGLLLPRPAELFALQRVPGLPERDDARGGGRRAARPAGLLPPRALLGARRLLLRVLPAARALRGGVAGHPRQPAAHERARLQRHRAPRGRLFGGRPHRRRRWRADGLVQRPGVAGLGGYELADQHPDHRGARRHAAPDRAVHRGRRVRAAAELRGRSGRPRALQPADRRRVPGHRAVLARRPARLVGTRSAIHSDAVRADAPARPAEDVTRARGGPLSWPRCRIHREEETMKSLKRQLVWTVVVAAMLAVVVAGGATAQQQVVKIGLLATLEGPFAAGGQDGMRGAELAVKQRGGMVAGKKIEIIKASSDAKPDVAVNATRKLVEQDKVDIMVGPLSGSEGIAVKNYSKTQPNTTFINGSSGAQATTLVDPSPNFFRFNTEGAQWMVGLGDYAYKTKNYKKMALIAEDYAFPYSQVQGFMTEYCKAGGRVTHKAWVPLGGKDYSSVIAKLPGDVDALLVVLGGADAVNFLTQYEQAGGNKPMVGGSITVDQTVLNFKGKRRESLLGTPSASPIADNYDAPEWKKFVADYKENFKDGFPSPSLFAYVYYINMKAALDGLDAVKGDLCGGQAKYREALRTLKLKTPTGEVTLDENRQAIGTTFVTEVAKAADGGFYNKVVKVVPNVNQRLGMSKADFDKAGLGSRDVPNCP